MKVNVTENRVEYQTRSYEVELPDGTDLEDLDRVWHLIQDVWLDREADFETVSATQELVGVQELVAEQGG